MSFEIADMELELYNIILQKEFEDFLRYYMAEIDYDEFICKVYVDYRIKHGKFPLMDDKMSQRLPIVVVEVGRKLMKEVEDYFENPEFDNDAYKQNLHLYQILMT